MKKDTHIKQHFLPKCYLKNFSLNEKNVYIYDKKAHKAFSNSLNSIAYFPYLYEIPIKYLSQKLKTPYGSKYFERAFFAEHIEQLYAEILNTILGKANQWTNKQQRIEVLTSNEKEILAQLIAIQHLRMPNVKIETAQSYEKLMQESLAIFKSGITNIYPELDVHQAKFEYDKDYDTLLHSKLYANQEFVCNFASQILDKHWIFYISDSTDFYTSDNPIIIKPHISNKPYYYDGFGMEGVEIIFPISKSILLTMWDSNHFPGKQKKNNNFELLTTKEINLYNCYQYIYANQQVYSYSNNFSIIEFLKSENEGAEIIMKGPKTFVNGK